MVLGIGKSGQRPCYTRYWQLCGGQGRSFYYEPEDPAISARVMFKIREIAAAIHDNWRAKIVIMNGKPTPEKEKMKHL